MSNKNSSEGKKLKKKTSAKIEVPVRDLINNFIVFNDTSFIYEVMTEKNDLGKLLLRKGNMYLKFDRKTIQQGLVDGKYRRPNEHELKKHLIKEQEYFQELTSKLVHRIILAQALIECNDDLRDDYADDKYISNILEKSTKQLERLATAAYNNMFKTDPKILTYFLDRKSVV